MESVQRVSIELGEWNDRGTTQRPSQSLPTLVACTTSGGAENIKVKRLRDNGSRSRFNATHCRNKSIKGIITVNTNASRLKQQKKLPL